jgi:hypothetical protein
MAVALRNENEINLGETFRNDNIVHDGDTIIVKMHDELDTMIKIISSTEQKIGKGRVDVTPIIGCSYGSIFEIRGKKLIKVDESSTQEGIFETPLLIPAFSCGVRLWIFNQFKSHDIILSNYYNIDDDW